MMRNYIHDMHSRFNCVAALLVLVLLTVCAIQQAVAADVASATTRYTLETLPHKEAWAGLTFNGMKVGFTHTRIASLPGQPGRYEIIAESSLALRMFGFEKKIQFKSRDIVGDDLALAYLDAEYLMDGNTLSIKGSAESGRLSLAVTNAGNETARELPYSGLLYPVSALTLYPLLHGLAVGQTYRYAVFNGETLQIGTVEQQVDAFEGSDLFDGEAYKVTTLLDGRNNTVWLDRSGRALLEIALNGVLTSVLEDERTAREYLLAASLNQKDVVVAFSLVKTDRTVALPGRVARMTLELDGIGFPVPSGAGQRCFRQDAAWQCDLDSTLRDRVAGDTAAYLRPSLAVPSNAPSIRKLAADIAAESHSGEAKLHAILDWLRINVRKEAADGFSALDVLFSRRAECQGHTYLYAALARASGIPTRVANGLVYSEAHGGFLYHTWAESLLNGEWRALDPTFGQPVADATHVKLLEGEDYADIAPLADLLGRVAARVLSFEYAR